MEIDKDWVKDVLKGRNGIEEVIDIAVRPAIGENENYGSALYRLDLQLKMQNQQFHSKSVILKVKSLKSSSYSAKEEEVVFDTETRIYSEVFPAMEKLIKEAGENEEILWPRYLGHKKLYLLMEDLLPDGFGVYPKEKPLDLDHTEVVMRVYGKLHGLGLILAQRGLVPVQHLRTQFITGDVMVFPKFYTSGVQGLIRVMEQWGSEWADLIPEIKSSGENIGEKLKQLAIKTEESGPCVFNHGDCWTNNILFKYEPGVFTPQHIRLVDFQMGHFNSPAWDLTYFFYNALLPQERFEKMHSLVTTYAESLAETLKTYAYKGRTPKTEDIMRGVQGLAYYGFLNTVTIRPLLIASAQEGYSLESEKLLDDYPGGPQCIHKPSFYTSPEIHEILKEEVKQYLKYK